MNWQNADGHLRKYGPLFQFVFVSALVIGDIFFPELIILTWQLVALIVLLTVIPYVPLIKKVKYGDVEAELESLLVHAERTIEEPNLEESTQEKQEEKKTQETNDEDSKDITEPEKEENKKSENESGHSEEVSNLRKMVNAEERLSKFKNDTNHYISEDPIVALSNLRMELDNTLFAIAKQHDILYRREVGVSFYDLLDNDILSEQDAEDLEQVYQIADKAIHGEEVKQETAQRIMELGERVLKRLYLQIDADISTDPSEPPIDVE